MFVYIDSVRYLLYLFQSHGPFVRAYTEGQADYSTLCTNCERNPSARFGFRSAFLELTSRFLETFGL